MPPMYFWPDSLCHTWHRVHEHVVLLYSNCDVALLGTNCMINIMMKATVLPILWSAYWCSIWWLRWPVNQSQNGVESVFLVPLSYSKDNRAVDSKKQTREKTLTCISTHPSFWSKLTSIGMWFDWVTHTNQWLSKNLSNTITMTLLLL